MADLGDRVGTLCRRSATPAIRRSRLPVGASRQASSHHGGWALGSAREAVRRFTHRIHRHTEAGETSQAEKVRDPSSVISRRRPEEEMKDAAKDRDGDPLRQRPPRSLVLNDTDPSLCLFGPRSVFQAEGVQGADRSRAQPSSDAKARLDCDRREPGPALAGWGVCTPARTVAFVGDRLAAVEGVQRGPALGLRLNSSAMPVAWDQGVRCQVGFLSVTIGGQVVSLALPRTSVEWIAKTLAWRRSCCGKVTGMGGYLERAPMPALRRCRVMSGAMPDKSARPLVPGGARIAVVAVAGLFGRTVVRAAVGGAGAGVSMAREGVRTASSKPLRSRGEAFSARSESRLDRPDRFCPYSVHTPPGGAVDALDAIVTWVETRLALSAWERSRPPPMPQPVAPLFMPLQ